MFRKITHIVLTIYLLVSTTGITFSIHYCGDKYVTTSINKEAQSCCNKKDGCCKNKTIHLNSTDNYLNSIEGNNIRIVELDTLFPAIFPLVFKASPLSHGALETYTDTSPPIPINTFLSLLQTYLC